MDETKKERAVQQINTSNLGSMEHMRKDSLRQGKVHLHDMANNIALHVHCSLWKHYGSSHGMSMASGLCKKKGSLNGCRKSSQISYVSRRQKHKRSNLVQNSQKCKAIIVTSPQLKRKDIVVLQYTPKKNH